MAASRKAGRLSLDYGQRWRNLRGREVHWFYAGETLTQRPRGVNTTGKKKGKGDTGETVQRIKSERPVPHKGRFFCQTAIVMSFLTLGYARSSCPRSLSPVL